MPKVTFSEGLPSHAIIVALHIAMDHLDDSKTIEEYGTMACDELREWRNNLMDWIAEA